MLHCSADKDPNSQSYGFPTSHIWMWELDYKEGWALKNRCFQTMVLQKTLESPLDNKEIKPVHPKGNQPWILIGRTDAGVLRFMGSQRVGHDWATELNWTELNWTELMLKLKLQYLLGYLLQRVNTLEKTLMQGKTEDKMRRWWQRMR